MPPRAECAFQQRLVGGIQDDYVFQVEALTPFNAWGWKTKDPPEETDLEDSNGLESQWDEILSKKCTFQLWG